MTTNGGAKGQGSGARNDYRNANNERRYESPYRSKASHCAPWSAFRFVPDP